MATLTFQQGVDGYDGTSDTMLREKTPDKSYFDSGNVNIDGSDSSGKLNEGLLYIADIFGAGSGQIPIGATISSATLTLEVTDGTSETFTLNRMLIDWMALPSWTWNSLGNGIQTDGVEASATADVIQDSIGSGTQDIDVTKSLQAWANGEANYGWALLLDGSNGWDFESSEGSLAPKLKVNWEIIEPPKPGLTVTESDSSTFVSEGGDSDSFDFVLNAAPEADVTVTIAGNTDIQVSPATVTFTTANWNIAQSVTLEAADDALEEGTEVSGISLSTSSADSNFDNLSKLVEVTVYDNDSVPLPISGPVVVAVHDTTQYTLGDPSGYGNCDPSGLAYVPGLDLLFIADSEHNESPFFSPTNLFAVRPDGTQVASYSLTKFCKEPTGLAYNSNNEYLYITDDDADKIFWVDPANPEVLIGQFSLKAYGITDAEDPAYDPVTGHLLVLDGFTRHLHELTISGDLVRSVALPPVVEDAEGMAYDVARDVFYIGSGQTRGLIFEVDHEGNLLSTIDLLNEPEFRNPETGSKPKIKGLELVPSSDPSDRDHMNLFIADYGRDQFPDGRLFELDLNPDWLIA